MTYNSMINFIKDTLWSQFGASIDMLKNAIAACPDEAWNTNDKFFYISYHSLIFLDYYLTIPPQEISSPLPFTIAAPGTDLGEAVDDLVPNRKYSKEELHDYLESSREKCKKVIDELTEEKLQDRWKEISGDRNYPILKLLLFNMRHVQHHAAQLNMMLRQQTNNSPGWISSARD